MINENQSAFIIANPRAGRMRRASPAKREWNGVPCIWRETTHIGHAESMAHEASLQGFRWIVAAGGDGTIHEVLNGMMKNPNNESVLGWIATGTANDYAASFAKGRIDLSSPITTSVDVGRLRWGDGCRYFANVAGIGFSAQIANRARRMPRIPARLRYTGALLWQLGPAYGSRKLLISVDDEPASETETLFMSAAIGKQEGSYPLHLSADLTDGCFEILRIDKLYRRELAWYFPSMLRGKLPENHPHVHRLRCRKLEIQSAGGIPIHLDGESPHRSTSATFKQFILEVVPRAIRCLFRPHPAWADQARKSR